MSAICMGAGALVLVPIVSGVGAMVGSAMTVLPIGYIVKAALEPIAKQCNMQTNVASPVIRFIATSTGVGVLIGGAIGVIAFGVSLILNSTNCCE